MAADRPNPTLADYVTLVFSPVLIMGLVGSLVFFLLEVLYPAGGQWRERLQWILFFFVFGAVLTGRIAMTGEISSRAGLYGSILALLTYIAMQRFVEYPESVRSLSFLVNLVLVGVVWWCAHRLTWDCTNVDEETDMSGEGLLQAAGLEDRPPPPAGAETDEDGHDAKTGASWLDRYRRYRDERQKRRTLGVWVVYFSLAALPIFGLGQSLIPATAPDRRRFAFWLMTVYVACALGLLLTTCFLGLRRYLRQKRLRMPAAMTAMWLIAGGGLVVVLLVLGALLPRPSSEYPLLTFLRPADPAKRQANRFAPKGDSPGEGKGQPGAPAPTARRPARRVRPATRTARAAKRATARAAKRAMARAKMDRPATRERKTRIVRTTTARRGHGQTNRRSPIGRRRRARPARQSKGVTRPSNRHRRRRRPRAPCSERSNGWRRC
ncbi:MAG: hypothetical protein U0736_05490 [Gemmataceae bacterium]